jgi:hypothetical protein
MSNPQRFLNEAQQLLPAAVALRSQIHARPELGLDLPLTTEAVLDGLRDLDVDIARGETEERLYLLTAWRESPLYSERERAAPAWTEEVTLVSDTHVPDVVYDQARQHFSETELVNLTLCVAAINAWNRLAISFRAVHPVHWKGAA